MRSPRRRSILALLGCAAAAAVAVPIIAVSAPAGTKTPDLRADAPEGIIGPDVYSDTGAFGANRLLVRFDGFVTNVGNGPLEIRGNPQIAGNLRQYAWSSTQGTGSLPTVDVTRPNLEVIFETADGHNHFHLKRAMEYSLWNQAKTAQVAPGQKVGFCLYDSQPAPNPGAVVSPIVYVDAVTHFCESGDPGSTSLRMGVGAGRRDVYGKTLAYQWVDVSRTAPGTYLVASAADPNDSIWEGDGGAETNPRAFASQPVTVPGYTARPVTVAQTGAAQAIALSTTTSGTPGPRRFRIVTPPSHGTLAEATGATFAGPSVTYTPDPGYTGPDSFTYVARDQNSAFPTSGFEPAATASILAQATSVAISGAPASLVAGTSAQLSATVAGTSGGVTWSTTAGTISADGLLVAPAAPPAGGSLTVRATSVTTPGVSAEVVIAITAAPVALPAPLPAPVTPPAVAGSNKLLSRLSTGHIGKRMVIGTITTGPKAGRVDMIISFKGRVLGRCGARVGARKTVSCKITLARAYPLAKIRVTAKLSLGGTSKAVRRAFVSTAA